METANLRYSSIAVSGMDDATFVVNDVLFCAESQGDTDALKEHLHDYGRGRMAARVLHIGVTKGAQKLARWLEDRNHPKPTLCWVGDATVELVRPFLVARKAHKGWTEMMVTTMAVNRGEAAILQNDDEIWEWMLAQATVPLADTPEWRKAAVASFHRHAVRWASAYDKLDTAGYDIPESVQDAIGRDIEWAVKRGNLIIPNGVEAPNVGVRGMDIPNYMLTFGLPLSSNISSQALHQPGTAPAQPLLRKPYMAQADAAAAIVKGWKSQAKCVFLIGEQGCGKTLISLAAASQRLDGRPGVILVHCPAHLAKKWEREVHQTLANMKVRHIRTMADAFKAAKSRPKTQEIWILQRDRGKLPYTERPAFRTGLYGRLTCPNCGVALQKREPNSKPKDETMVDMTPKDFEKKNPANTACPNCSSPLWQMDGSRLRRVALTKILKKARIDVLIADEAHEERADSLQGQSLARLIAVAKRSVMVTATLIGGKSTDMFHHLKRTQGRAMREAGYEGEKAFIDTYGSFEYRREMVEAKSGLSKTRVRTVDWKERSGISPMLFPDWMIGRSVFIDLQDLKANLPRYSETVTMSKMTQDQWQECARMAEEIRKEAAQALARGEKPNYSSMIHRSLAFPDIAGKESDALAKESAIAMECLKEKKLGRRCAVYIRYTHRFDLSDRLTRVMESWGLKVDHLTSAVPPEKREEWLNNTSGDVLITHSKLVDTGLDLVQFPTLIWAQTGYSLFDLRQASRRSWRLGQSKPVKVIFHAYEGTLQEGVLRILGERAAAASMIEGRMSSEGLAGLLQNSDVMRQVAELLMTGLSKMPKATDIWTQSTEDMELEAAELAAAEQRLAEQKIAEQEALAKTVAEPEGGSGEPVVDFAAWLKAHHVEAEHKRRARRAQISQGQLSLFDQAEEVSE